jgi:hypothetical protein
VGEEGVMPVIKPRTRGKQLVRHITRFDRENNEILYAYAHFLGEPTEYVLNQLVETVLAKDKDFVTWRAHHGGSFVPAKQKPHPIPPGTETPAEARQYAQSNDETRVPLGRRRSGSRRIQ